jgi:CDP-diacylglycerol--serine O-phosphatidyltransferase
VTSSNDPVDRPPEILSFAKDLPNVCSLIGLFAAMLAIYFAILGVFPAAMIALIWAVFFDWSDGIIARRMKGRSEVQSEFGAQLDSLIDVISFSICPAIVLLSYGGFEPWYLPGAFLILAAGVLRLSFFNIYGLAGGSNYIGLALDNNAIVLVALFALEPLVGQSTFAVVLYVTLMVLTALNVASIKTPKFQGGWYYALAIYAFAATGIFTWQLFGVTGA